MGHGELKHAEVDEARLGGAAGVEAEDELVEVALPVPVSDRALMGAQEPAFHQRRDSVDRRQ